MKKVEKFFYADPLIILELPLSCILKMFHRVKGISTLKIFFTQYLEENGGSAMCLEISLRGVIHFKLFWLAYPLVVFATSFFHSTGVEKYMNHQDI